MNKISNYGDLLTEKLRLEDKIHGKKQNIQASLTGLKEKLTPFILLFPILSFVKKGRLSGLLKSTFFLGMKWLVGRKLLSKSSWLVKLLVPGVQKQPASSIIHNH